MHELNNPKSAAANIELTVTLGAAHRTKSALVSSTDFASQKWFHAGDEARN
jgi:hypothetical protein